MPDNKKTIFVIDDEEINLDLLQGILEDDYKVNCFNNGKSCLQAFEEIPADIVLLDVEMPELDGLETCRRLLELAPNLPVVFISAKSSQEERLAGYSAGGYDYIIKPCDANELLAKIKIIIQQQEQQQQISEQHQNISQAFMEVASGSGEQGILIRFAIAVFELKTHQELAEALIASLGELNGLKGSVLIKGQKEHLFWSDRGTCPPIEMQILETLQNKGRIYEFSDRIQVNETHVSALIKNMPEDEMSRGRYRDHIPLLLRIASAQTNKLNTDAVLTSSQQRMETIQNVCHQLSDAEAVLHNNISNFIVITEDEFERIQDEVQYLALSEEQEVKLLSSLEKALKQAHKSANDAIEVCSRFGEIVSTLKQTL